MFDDNYIVILSHNYSYDNVQTISSPFGAGVSWIDYILKLSFTI